MTYLLYLFIALPCFWAANKISWQVRTDAASGMNPGEIFNHCLTDLTENPLHISGEPRDLIAGALVAMCVVMLLADRTARNRQRRRGEEHGSATWASRSDIRPYKNRTTASNLLFTRTESLSLDSRTTQRNLNACIIGGSGSGKTRYYVMPNIHQANTSYVITDPKGELYRATSAYLEENGYQVRVLNLIDFARSDQFNPMAYFNPNQAEVDCTILTENLVTNTSGKRPLSGGDFWEKAERALLNALISYVYFTQTPTQPGTLIDVVNLLADMQASEQDEEKQSKVDLIFDAVKDLLEEYDDYPPEKITSDARTMLGGLRFAHSQYNTYLQGAGETKKSVIISLGVRMAPLHMAQIRHLLAQDTIRLDLLGKEKTALYLIIPDTHATFNFLAAIFYEQLFETNLYIADHNDNGRLDVMVQCFMDEFANIGKLPSFERKIAVMRSRGISVSVIIQNFAQGKSLYKDDWETIIGNCDSLLFLGGQEKSTTDYVSKMLGKQTIIGTDTSLSKGRSGSFSRSDRLLGRELLTGDEVGRLPTDKCIYILRGVRPFLSRKLHAPTFS
ncbi:conjugation protein [Actinobaculum suis]|uniref:Conjugation protein n=1 Tax=Actinobaculum suis TaxID=1657 RepID=A0A7Z9C7V4_9ACTO|nr:type IV secretory system conjugative DNA transfer family protein [Actinobaculum suis]VDG75784.1 conjugation protein [Actinobaculum suis]